MNGTAANISVAITTCGRPAYVRECLLSVCRQTLPPAEIVVSQDGGDARTTQAVQGVVALYPHLRFVHVINETPLGQLANRQQAFRLTTGEYAAMLDDDDCWSPKFLETTYAALQQYPECGFCSSNHTFMNERGIVNTEQSRRFAAYCGRTALKPGVQRDVFSATVGNEACIFSLQFTLFRRSALERAGFFQPYGGLVPDFALMLALGSQGTTGCFAEPYLGSSRVHGGQQTTRRLDNALSKVECLSEIYKRYAHALTPDQLSLLGRMFRKSLLENAIAYAHMNRRKDAAKLMRQLTGMGIGLPPLRRMLVLAALLLGVRKPQKGAAAG